MKAKYIIPLLFLPYSSPVFSGDSWDTMDYSLASLSTAALILDWRQTHEIAKNANYIEHNKYLGEKPSAGKVNVYFGTIVVGNLVIANLLPSQYRKIQLGTVAFLEFAVTSRNYMAGITVPF